MWGSRMRGLFAALFVLLFASGSAQAGAQLTGYGMYSGVTTNCSGTGPILECTLSNATHVATTTEIPGTLGVTFGIQYKLDSGTTPLHVTIVFPPAGLHNPRFPKAVQSFSNDEVCAGANCFDSYSFDFPWEIVEGYWTIQVRAGGQLLLQQRFHVYLPDKKKPKKVPGKLISSL